MGSKDNSTVGQLGDVALCSVCHERKPVSEFYPDPARGNGLSSRCRDCAKGRAAVYKADWYERNRTRALDGARLNAYGVTPAEYASLLFEQGGVCAICRRPEASLNRRGEIRALNVDHDHETRRVRGLLCSNCNRGVGCFRDDPERLASAIAYLERRG